MGQLPRRASTIVQLTRLPQAALATSAEVMRLIGEERLFGSGVGYIDAHLLAAVRLTTSARLWTRDKRLETAARKLGVAATRLH